MMIRLSLLIVLIALVPARAASQSAEEWLERGHQAARSDRHVEAIAAYERAIELQPSLRGDLLARLGRHYLWSDRPEHASRLLREFLAIRGDQCDVRNDYGLALAWSGDLSEARAAFDAVSARCPREANTARLRNAMVLRWQDRPTRAAVLYEEVRRTGSATEQHAALVGLGHVAMLADYNRDALRRFTAAAESATTSEEAAAARGGLALALARLGELPAASDEIAAVGAVSELPRDLRELRQRIETADDVQAAPLLSALRDADGTAQTSYSIGGTIGWSLHGRAGVRVGQWLLENDRAEYSAFRAAGEAEYRQSPSLALRAELGVARVDSLDWNPVSGEVHAIITPDDRLRIDLAAARLILNDNVAAVGNRLAGRYLSAGADLRVSDGVTLVGAADVTQWSTDNRRVRLRAAVRKRFEGVPRLTLELPMLLQLYDEPFAFALFSPDTYIEAGPAANLYKRMQQHWNVSLYARVGAQKEAERSWNPFGTVQLRTWRDLQDGWSLQSGIGWSNSNLASSGSFRRSAFTLGVTRSF